MKAAGYEPGYVDAVVLTHMHPDRVGGLAGADGKPAFPNATLIVSGTEYKFWTGEAIMGKAPEAARVFFKLAQDQVKPYAKSLQLVKDGDEIASGISIGAAAGHTPGHSAVRVSSGNDTLLISGDIVHVAALQFPHPEWAISIDSDQAQAIETRKKMFDQVSADGTLIAGMHLDFPGLGYVNREAGQYSFQRAIWSRKL